MNLELIFLQVDFFSHFMGGGAGGFSWAVSTLYLEFLYFFLNYSDFFCDSPLYAVFENC